MRDAVIEKVCVCSGHFRVITCGDFMKVSLGDNRVPISLPLSAKSIDGLLDDLYAIRFKLQTLDLLREEEEGNSEKEAQDIEAL